MMAAIFAGEGAAIGHQVEGRFDATGRANDFCGDRHKLFCIGKRDNVGTRATTRTDHQELITKVIDRFTTITKAMLVRHDDPPRKARPDDDAMRVS